LASAFGRVIVSSTNKYVGVLQRRTPTKDKENENGSRIL